ncbi:MAG: response regulator transcription factor [Nanoarchaeota archaeon]
MDKKKILIVDDEPQIVDLVKLMLGEESYDFIEAYDGFDALEKAKTQLPNLILLDIMMPGMDGYEVCQKLRANPKTKNIVIAMVSAKKEDHDILEGIDVGAVAYITKPFDGFELGEKVKELLEINN